MEIPIENKIHNMILTLVSNQLKKANTQQNPSIIFDFNEIDIYDTEIGDKLIESPDETIRLFREAIHCSGMISEKIGNLDIQIKNIPTDFNKNIRDLRSRDLEKLVVIEGVVRVASKVRPELIRLKWRCPKCDSDWWQEQETDVVKKPKRCPQFTCSNSKGFILESREFGDLQSIIIEENPEDLAGGQQPARILVELRNSLVEPELNKIITPGNSVRISGILRQKSETSTKEDKKREMFITAFHVKSLDKNVEDIRISSEDMEKIKEISKKDPLKLFTKSIAPSIFGRFPIKKAIALQLFGGVRRPREDGTVSRGDIHVLVIGDPASGKSQMLKYVSEVAPKTRYVSGQGASGVGLTASVVKDDFLKTWTLEAGAMVLANGGVVCLDEMDKIGREETFALHEAMAQQTVTVAKANIFATLKCRTSVLAAANPKHGRFDTSSSFVEQIDLPETIISRFDLIFPVLDVPNSEQDRSLAEHILAFHSGKSHQLEETIDPLLFKKYIAYAKSKINPELSQQAKNKIIDFFVEMRNKFQETHTLAISPRQLEALIRLSEASARLRLSKKVEIEDTNVAISIMKESLFQSAYDSISGVLDIDLINTKIPHRKRKIQRSIMEIIKKLVNEENLVDLGEVYETALRKDKLTFDEVEDALSHLKSQGYLTEPKRGKICLI